MVKTLYSILHRSLDLTLAIILTKILRICFYVYIIFLTVSIFLLQLTWLPKQIKKLFINFSLPLPIAII